MASDCSSAASDKRPFTLDEFKIMLEESEQNIGCTTEQIENGNMVRKKTGREQNLMYGRVKVDALESIFKIMDLKDDDIFIDLGHGIGVVSAQASYTKGCEARGIEIEEERFVVSQALTLEIEHRKRLMREKDLEYRDDKKVGAIKLKLGDFTKREHWRFITEANKIFVNNAQGIFAEKCYEKNFDDYVASLFARTKPGTVMVTCWPLMSLGRSVEEENEQREKVHLPPNPSASFFEYEQRNIGALSTTWGGDLTPLQIWVYKRTPSEGFLCSNPKCSGSSIFTSMIQGDGDLLNDTCIFCNIKRKPTLRRNKVIQGGGEKSDVVSAKRSKRQRKPILKNKRAIQNHCVDNEVAKKSSDTQVNKIFSSSISGLQSSNEVRSDSASSSSYSSLYCPGSSSDTSDDAVLSCHDESKSQNEDQIEEDSSYDSAFLSQSPSAKSTVRKRKRSVSKALSSKSSAESIIAQKKRPFESESENLSSSDSELSFGEKYESIQGDNRGGAKTRNCENHEKKSTLIPKQSKDKRREELKEKFNVDSTSLMTTEMKTYAEIPQSHCSVEPFPRNGSNGIKRNIEEKCTSIGGKAMDRSKKKSGQVKILSIPAKSRPKRSKISESKKCEIVDLKQKSPGVSSNVAAIEGSTKNKRESDSRQIEKNAPRKKQRKGERPPIVCLSSSEESDAESGTTNIRLCNQAAQENKIRLKKNIEIVDLT